MFNMDIHKVCLFNGYNTTGKTIYLPLFDFSDESKVTSRIGSKEIIYKLSNNTGKFEEENILKVNKSSLNKGVDMPSPKREFHSLRELKTNNVSDLTEKTHIFTYLDDIESLIKGKEDVFEVQREIENS